MGRSDASHVFYSVNLDKRPDVALYIIFWSHIAVFLKNNGYICIMIDLRTEEKKQSTCSLLIRLVHDGAYPKDIGRSMNIKNEIKHRYETTMDRCHTSKSMVCLIV